MFTIYRTEAYPQFTFQTERDEADVSYTNARGEELSGGVYHQTIYTDYYHYFLDKESGVAVNKLVIDYFNWQAYTYNVYDGALEARNLTITASNADDLVIGGSGADRINSLGGYDEIWAGAGDDTIYVRGTGLIHGEDGKDRIYGGSGADWLDGGAQRDVLTGGSGKDTFVFASVNPGDIDHITAFSVKDDTIALENAIFKGMGAAVDASEFKDITDGAKLDANDRVLYNHDTGRLWYDRDGSGAAARQQFAILDNHPTITHADFVLI